MSWWNWRDGGGAERGREVAGRHRAITGEVEGKVRRGDAEDELDGADGLDEVLLDWGTVGDRQWSPR